MGGAYFKTRERGCVYYFFDLDWTNKRDVYRIMCTIHHDFGRVHCVGCCLSLASFAVPSSFVHENVRWGGDNRQQTPWGGPDNGIPFSLYMLNIFSSCLYGGMVHGRAHDTVRPYAKSKTRSRRNAHRHRNDGSGTR